MKTHRFSSQSMIGFIFSSFSFGAVRLCLIYAISFLYSALLLGQDEQPNVLFIAIDDMRPELGCYGQSHIKSPHIDALAARGVLFERAYCQVPVCGPSRASLLTGIRPTARTCKIWDADQYAPGAVTLPQAFREAGYHTISNSKIFHAPGQAAERSWSESPTGHETHQEYFDPDSKKFASANGKRGPFIEGADVPDDQYLDGKTCEKSINDLKRLAKMDKPFFLAVGFVRPHLPFYAPKKYWDLYDREKIEIADNRYTPKGASFLKSAREIRSYDGRGIKYNSDEFHRAARHGYYACVSYVDALVGRILDTLDDLNLTENTIVVVWGDHGWHLGEHNFWGKHNLLHNATRAPLIISAPGYQNGQRTSAMVELIDLYPTLCELAGVAVSERVDGTSMVPLLDGSSGAAGKEVVITRFMDGVTATTSDFSYTEYPKKKTKMLYDLREDSRENVNLVDQEAFRGVVKRLSEAIEESVRKGR